MEAAARLTAIGPLTSATEASRPAPRGIQPTLLWDVPTVHPVEQGALLTNMLWFLPGADGTAFAMSKISPREIYTFRTEGPIDRSPGQHGDIGYLTSRDETLYAINLPNGDSVWTYSTGTPFLQRPMVTDPDVFVVTRRYGLQRLLRDTGAAVWRSPVNNVERFLAANPKFVYARDLAGRLLVIDRAAGTMLSCYGMIDYTVALGNELTDRIYLGAQDGLLICLHDRDYAQPVHTKTREIQEQVALGNPILNKLNNTVSLPKGMVGRSFKESIDFFDKTFKLPIVVAEQAFIDVGDPGVLERQVQLNRLDLIPLGEIVKQLVKQVNGTYLVQPDHVLVVPAKGRRP